MAETKALFARKIIEGREPEGKSFTSERQLAAQAFNLHVDFRGGRHAEGVGWSHYFTYRWLDKGDHESLDIIFSGRAIEIEGHNLGILVREIREGQLNGVLEMVSAEAELKRVEADDGPIIRSVKISPDFDELLKEIKGDDREPGFAGKVRGR
jgi:hypothetical protein